MATRGVYRFHFEENQSIDVYIHYDNYPMGAAHYFYWMLCDWHKAKGNTLTRFVRSVPDAEIQIGGNKLGWIEYLYEVWGSGNSATIKAWEVENEEPTACIFDGKLIDFISEFSVDWREPMKPFKQTADGILNSEQARVLLFARTGPMEILSRPDVFNKDNINYKLALETVQDYTTHFPELLEDPDIAEILKLVG